MVMAQASVSKAGGMGRADNAMETCTVYVTEGGVHVHVSLHMCHN